jgi:hypothetical protein
MPDGYVDRGWVEYREDALDASGQNKTGATFQGRAG